jgi:hypothetical protein
MSAVAVAAMATAGHREIAGELETLATRLREVTVRIHTSRGRFDGVGAGVIWRLTGKGAAMTCLSRSRAAASPTEGLSRATAHTTWRS